MTVEYLGDLGDLLFSIGGFVYNAETEEFDVTPEEVQTEEDFIEVTKLIGLCPEGFTIKNLVLAHYLVCDLEDLEYIETQNLKVVTENERKELYNQYCEDKFIEIVNILSNNVFLNSVASINHYWKNPWYRDFEVANPIDEIFPIVETVGSFLILNR